MGRIMFMLDIYKILFKYNLNGRWNLKISGVLYFKGLIILQIIQGKKVFFVFVWCKYEYYDEYFKLVYECFVKLFILNLEEG